MPLESCALILAFACTPASIPLHYPLSFPLLTSDCTYVAGVWHMRSMFGKRRALLASLS